ncbi:hypothetical protein LCGC14_2146460, partial [marine sediment metagenome]
IVKMRQQLLALFSEFAGIAKGWDPEEEDDYDEFVSEVDKVLEK